VASSQDAEPPRQFPNVPPPDMSVAAAQTRLIAKEVVQAVEFSVHDLKTGVEEIKGDVRTIKDHRWTDFMWHLAALIAALVIIGTGMVSAYFRLEDKIAALSTASTRIETKLDDLLARIPPVQPPAPRR